MLGQLSPQERAAMVLKDVFDLSLEETRTPAPAVLDAFCQAFNAGALDRLTALLLDTASVEARAHREGWVLVHWYSHQDGDAVRALFYADQLVPLGPRHPNLVSYLGRLRERPSFARVLEEAAPYLASWPPPETSSPS